MFKKRRLMAQESECLDDIYFKQVRPKLYELHGTHGQHGSRQGRTLAEHLDSACQFVLTVSRIAQVPEEKRGCILAATAVHDLNKLDPMQRNVKALARDRAFLEEQLERAGVKGLVNTDEDLELVRKLIERHSGHNVSDGTRFLPEDPNIAKWAAMLVGGDLFDLGIEEDKRIRKVENELTVAFGRPSHLFKITLSEDRGYLTSLLLSACEDVLHSKGLHTLAINPDSQIYEGEAFPQEDLTLAIAKQWQKRIDRVFSGNVEQLVNATKDGIKVDPQAIQQNPEAALERVEFELTKKFNGYKADKVAKDIAKYSSDAGEDAVAIAQGHGLIPVSSDQDFAISEGLKAAYLSYREAQLSPKDAWDRIASHTGLSLEQRNALEPFNPQYGRSLFAAKVVSNGIESIRATLEDSFQLRQVEDMGEVSMDLVVAVKRLLNLTKDTDWTGFAELTAYAEANPRQRCSLGAMTAEVDELISNKMPPGTKVQSFSNRLPGGMSAEPKRRGDMLSSLAYQLLTVGANFPKASKQDPLYLHFALPKGSSPQMQAMWQKWMRETAATNAEGGTVTFDELQLYRDGKLTFKENKVVGMALPKRPEFSYSTVTIPVVWGDANNSVALLKSLRLALEISLADDIRFPFVLSANLEVEPDWEIFGKVDGIPSSLQPLLGNGIYYLQRHLSEAEERLSITVEQVLERLQYIGKLTISIASLQKKDDCLYDLARAAQRPLDLYHVILRWILREQDDPNLETIWTRIKEPLNRLLESLMSEEHDHVSSYLKKAAYLAEVGKLRGSSFRRTAQAEPFSEFIKAVRSRKSHMDWDTIFAALVQDYHTRLDRIREHGVGATKYEQVKQFYDVLKQLFDEVYHSRPERLLTDSKTLEAAYLFFLQDARKALKAQTDANKTAHAETQEP
jgi:CRISPR-associated protein Csc3